MKVNDCPLVIVEWVDSENTTDWTAWDEIKATALTCYSAGWLKDKTDDALVLVSSMGVGANKQATNIIYIPMAAVSWIKEGRKFIYRKK